MSPRLTVLEAALRRPAQRRPLPAAGDALEEAVWPAEVDVAADEIREVPDTGTPRAFALAATRDARPFGT